MAKTNRDNYTAPLRESGSTDRELRAALCHVVRTCDRRGVYRMRDLVLNEEPVFYVDDDLR